MRWQRGYRSRDVIDARGRSRGTRASALGPLVALVIGRFGIGGVVLLVLVFAGYQFLASRDPAPVRSGTEPSGQLAQDDMVQFVSFVFDDVQRAWEQRFAAEGRAYRRAKLVLFTDRIDSACGLGTAATGPFYCPGDERVYIDLGFYRELAAMGAPGDFAEAYVIAHEVGHHVQHQLGALASGSAHGSGPSSGSVRTELQADCLAGLWAHSTRTRDLLEPGDLEEGLRATASIGDDRMQRSATGTVNPETWTHGSSAQRTESFRRGYESGALAACETSGAAL